MPVMLESVPKAFDFVTVFVKVVIELALDYAGDFRRDDRLNALFTEEGEEVIGIIAFVGNQGFRLAITECCFGMADIGIVAGCEHEADRIAESIGKSVNLRRQAATA